MVTQSRFLSEKLTLYQEWKARHRILHAWLLIGRSACVMAAAVMFISWTIKVWGPELYSIYLNLWTVYLAVWLWKKGMLKPMNFFPRGLVFQWHKNKKEWTLNPYHPDEYYGREQMFNHIDQVWMTPPIPVTHLIPPGHRYKHPWYLTETRYGPYNVDLISAIAAYEVFGDESLFAHPAVRPYHVIAEMKRKKVDAEVEDYLAKVRE